MAKEHPATNAGDAWQLATFDHGVDGFSAGAQQVGNFGRCQKHERVSHASDSARGATGNKFVERTMRA